MLEGLRDTYLKSLPSGMHEKDVVFKALQRYDVMAAEAARWNANWSTILGLFYPDMNNVNLGSSGGEIRVNKVYAGEPITNLMALTDFLVNSMFPRTVPWLFGDTVDQRMQVVKDGDLPIAVLQHRDLLVGAVRTVLSDANFYSEVRNYTNHFLTLGNASLRAKVGKNQKFTVTDVPVDKMHIQRDTNKEVCAVSWKERIERWEIYRDFGQVGLNLFAKAGDFTEDPSKFQRPGDLQVFTNGGGAFPGVGTYSAGGGGSNLNGAGGLGAQAFDVVKVLVPNDWSTMIPGGGRLYPEMGYVCYVITAESRRLLDVEMYTKLPVGVATDLIVSGEAYGRGLCGRILPDVAVLNKKKEYELHAEALAAGGALAITGSGFKKKPGKIRRGQMLHLKANTKVETLYDRSALLNRSVSIAEMSKLAVEKGMRMDKMQVEHADRMTGAEYTGRTDEARSLFAPLAAQIEKGVREIVDLAVDYAYLYERVPPPPQEAIQGGFDLRMRTRTNFEYGEGGQLVMNLLRAISPMAEFIQYEPQLLDNINMNRAFKTGLAQFEAADLLESEDGVRKKREARARMMAMQRGGTETSAAQQGEDKAAAEAAYARAQVDDAGTGELEFEGLTN